MPIGDVRDGAAHEAVPEQEVGFASGHLPEYAQVVVTATYVGGKPQRFRLPRVLLAGDIQAFLPGRQE